MTWKMMLWSRWNSPSRTAEAASGNGRRLPCQRVRGSMEAAALVLEGLVAAAVDDGDDDDVAAVVVVAAVFAAAVADDDVAA